MTDFVDQHVDAPLAEVKIMLAQQHLHVAHAHMLELRRQRVHADADDFAGSPRQGSLGHQRPAADHRPAVDFGIGLLHAFDFGVGVLRRFFVIVDFFELEVRVLLQLFFGAVDALLQVRGGLIAGQNGDHAFLVAEQFGHVRHYLPAGLDVVGADVAQPLRIRRVGVEAHHGHALAMASSIAPRDLAGVGAGDRDRIHAGRRRAAR